MELFLELFTLPFMQRALIAGIATAVPLAMLGVFVTAKGIAFFGDGIAHASLAGIALGLLIGVSPLWCALAVAVVFALALALLEEKSRLKSDTTLALLFTVGFAVAIVLLSMDQGFQPDIMSYLFGNILTISSADLLFIVPFAGVCALILLALQRRMMLLVLNREMAWLAGIPVAATHALLYTLLAITVVVAVKLLGVVLVSALLVIPVVAARQWARSLQSLFAWSVVFAELAVIGGLIASYMLDLPSGATIVLTGALLAGIAFVLRLRP
ncbi:MAG: metal ABC transporter permease [Patescibacteria group bacterium]